MEKGSEAESRNCLISVYSAPLVKQDDNIGIFPIATSSFR